MYKVLLVDDEKFILEGLSNLIDWEMFNLEIIGKSRGGKQALEALDSANVDILITDISMPGMNGLDLIRAARQSDPELKVIILSGYNEFEYLREGMRLGIENYLLKPVNTSELTQTLLTILDKLEAPKKAFVSSHDIHIIRNNTLHRWMTGQIAAAEWEERFELLQLGETQCYRAAAIIQGGELSDLAVEQLDSIHQPSKEHLIVYRDPTGDVTLVFQGAHKEQLKQHAESALLQLVAQLESQEAGKLRIGLGRVEETETSEPLSYSDAQKALEYFLLYPDNKMIKYEALDRLKAVNPTEGGIRSDKYNHLLHARDVVHLTAVIREDLTTLRQKEGMTPKLLSRLAAEVIIRLKLAVEEVRPADSALEQRFADHLEAIHQAGDWFQLMDIIELTVQLAVDSLQPHEHSPVIRQVLKLVDSSYAENWTLKQLGEQFRIHPVYLGQLFRKETGESFAEYLNHCRVEAAKKLLLETSLKVSEVAEHVGYCETVYFNRQFRKNVGVSPMEYRSLV